MKKRGLDLSVNHIPQCKDSLKQILAINLGP